MEKYTKIVQNLLASGIKLVAVDFDLTILNVHTRGFWQFTSKMLATRVRPCFQKFLTVAVNSDLHVAVVTQSPQVSLVQEVLEQTLPDCDTGRIVIRGADGTWKMLKGVSKEGKYYSLFPVMFPFALVDCLMFVFIMISMEFLLDVLKLI